MRTSVRSTAVLLVLALTHLTGCPQGGGGSGGDGAKDVKLTMEMGPKPLKVGPATTTIHLADKDDKPVEGAVLKLEGNMNHAGMKPVFASAKESDPGKYEATLQLTMGGDWFVLVSGTLADGRKLSRKVEVPGVKSR